MGHSVNISRLRALTNAVSVDRNMNRMMRSLRIAIKGAGDIASGVAWRLYMAHMRNILMFELPHPKAVRRSVSFSEAVYDGRKTVEGVAGVRVQSIDEIGRAWDNGAIAVMVDNVWGEMRRYSPDVVVDAIMAKRNTGTFLTEARLVIGLGPGFNAPSNVHMVVETNRGHDLGRIITEGSAQEDTGTPGAVMGYHHDRVLRAPADGVFTSERSIGDHVRTGDEVGRVGGAPVRTAIAGVIRGLIRPGCVVAENLKIGDVDPRGGDVKADLISDKSRAIAGAVLEGILRVFNSTHDAG